MFAEQMGKTVGQRLASFRCDLQRINENLPSAQSSTSAVDQSAVAPVALATHPSRATVERRIRRKRAKSKYVHQRSLLLQLRPIGDVHAAHAVDAISLACQDEVGSKPDNADSVHPQESTNARTAVASTINSPAPRAHAPEIEPGASEISLWYDTSILASPDQCDSKVCQTRWTSLPTTRSADHAQVDATCDDGRTTLETSIEQKVQTAQMVAEMVNTSDRGHIRHYTFRRPPARIFPEPKRPPRLFNCL